MIEDDETYELFSAEKNTRQIMVLISDGETDLPGGSVCTEEQFDEERKQCVRRCKEETVEVYTVAFGRYGGSKAVLEDIAAQTGAKSCSVQGSEALIEVLYGIFQDSFIYQIQQFSGGTYAGGNQEIRCVLDVPYLDEVNILLLSSEPVGEMTVRYGEEEILLTGLSHYAVGKIGFLHSSGSFSDQGKRSSSLAGSMFPSPSQYSCTVKKQATENKRRTASTTLFRTKEAKDQKTASYTHYTQCRLLRNPSHSHILNITIYVTRAIKHEHEYSCRQCFSKIFHSPFKHFVKNRHKCFSRFGQ